MESKRTQKQEKKTRVKKHHVKTQKVEQEKSPGAIPAELRGLCGT